jgi:ribonuclease HI
VELYQQAELLNGVTKQNNFRHEVMIRWEPPLEGWVKLNTDGAAKAGTASGCGGVIRGSHGEWIGGFAKYLGVCSAYVAELCGVLEGLTYARQRGCSKIELNVDSSVVDRAIRSQGKGSPVGGALIGQIREMLALDWEVVIKYSYCEANKCADVLANIGCTLDSTIVYNDSCPTKCSYVMQADVCG